MSIGFLLVTLMVVITPGTGVLYTLSAGLSRGARAGVVAAFGCTLGIVPHMVAAITGLAALLYASSVAFETVKYLGVAYLVYMAWAIMRQKGALAVTGDAAPRSALAVIVSGILVNILNPKLTLFFFAFLPQFVAPNEPGAIVHMLGPSSVFMLVTFLVFVGYGTFAAAVRNQVVSRPRVITWMRRVFAAAFVALGAKLPSPPAERPARVRTRLVPNAPWGLNGRNRRQVSRSELGRIPELARRGGGRGAVDLASNGRRKGPLSSLHRSLLA